MQTGSLINHLSSQMADVDPTVGMGVTELCWTDRHAYTVVEVLDGGRQLVIQRDTATRADSHGMSDSQSYTYTPNPEGERVEIVKGRDNKWRRKGARKSGTEFKIGGRQEYHDYSF